MLKMVSKKSLLLFGVVLALSAFVLPSMAAAVGWEPVGTGTIDSTNLGFSVTTINSGSTCTNTQFHVQVHSTALATITAASFGNCHGDVGSGVGCTTTANGTNFPWAATAPGTTNIQIHGVDIDVSFEPTPGTLNECANSGLSIRLTGTVTASYTPGTHTFDFLGATGLFAHNIPVIGTQPAVARGNATPTGTLRPID